jgi:hypothetical protein
MNKERKGKIMQRLKKKTNIMVSKAIIDMMLKNKCR